jgi:hypothetical protein
VPGVRARHGGIGGSPRGERLLINVAHPLLALKEFGRPHA